MKHQVGTKTTKKPKTYRITNWHDYNTALVNRGRVTLWLDEAIVASWYNRALTGKQGKPQLYSAVAISTALTIREVFHLPLRQTEGFLNSLFTLMRLPLKTPDYSTLSIRGELLPVPIGRPRSQDGPGTPEPLHIVVDSTGVKVFGEGEWKVRKHGWSKHRSWRKLHLSLDVASQEIKSAKITGNDTADSAVLPDLLADITAPIGQCSADGAYDKRPCYEILADRQIKATIPPQRNAKIWRHGNRAGPPHPRDENLRRIRRVGRRRWKVESGYHERSLVETCMFRLKTIFGDKVSARKLAGQTTQLLLRCQALNKMTDLGMPRTVVMT